MTDKKNFNCSFCGKNRDAVEKLIAGPAVYICNECIELSYKIVTEGVQTQIPQDEHLDQLSTPSEIKQYLDQYIVGHDAAKEILAVSAYNHYKRIIDLDYSEHNDVVLEKTNLLLIGPTGSGKTLFAKTLAKKLNVPFAIADATTLTESGYVGEDVDSVLERLLALSEYDMDRAQRGIIYIDEVDKKARRSESAMVRDVSGEGVQQALLRLIEGTVTKVKINTGKKYNEEYVEFDTSNVMFILGGAFVGIEKQIQKRVNSSSHMGFGARINNNDDESKLLLSITHADVIEYGLIPELVGRLPIIASLEQLNEQQLITMMTKVKNNVIEQSKKLLSMDQIDLRFSQKYYEETARLAVQQKLGARIVKGLVENSLISLMFRAPELKKIGVVAVRFDNYPISSDIKPTLIFQDQREQADLDYKLYRGINEKLEQ
jgi:ATP-dependent Clp protease ATP-binding subunit ClpX